ncbi:SAM-dependent DNA methyltransferase [Verrucomicrobiaceae bacterium 5K15]|uniref:site-specific DNA-methyltransferase (adenine-specific) n=1 Tax=Oceaniferula flava TaxID=2800421 RepID=A0AAE2S9H8_9BACT|nr:class I SAM-dependent DNA methyltransferase [Oceaniferula flavus]MBK1853805.1 SAM-dependent DNA methyltransferase [Oceaniferula flavus]MBM1135111.1 SAM-dependent DNA methyltransferase [Oceaniferula flavus]
MSLTSTVKSIQDIMRKDAGVDGDAQRLSQLVWMLFLKIFDDRDQELELMDDDYVSIIPEKFQWRNWAADPEGITGDELSDFINNELFPTLKELDLSSADPRGHCVKDAFEDAYNYMKKGHLLRQVINKLNDIDFNSSDDRHAFGDLYEQLLRDLQAAGNSGEFYTPRAITQFIVDQINPQLGESILDPACGTGGFLTCAIEHLRSQVQTNAQRDQLQSAIHGVEKKPLPHLLCVTNMLLHGIEVPSQIRHDNTLARPLTSYGKSEKVDIVITNPPFGGTEDDGIESNFPSAFRTRDTADLFLLLILRLLKDKGRAALVLPDGTLFGEGVKTRLKEKLLSECNLHTIVRLPNGVFNPYTGIKTNLLFFEKGTPTKEVWYYEHPYPEGVKSYNKTKPIRIQEFDAEKAWWTKREENEHAWKVSIEDIKARNYNLDISNPHQEEVVHHDPDELLAQYDKQLQGIQEIRNQLKDILSEALTSK